MSESNKAEQASRPPLEAVSRNIQKKQRKLARRLLGAVTLADLADLIGIPAPGWIKRDLLARALHSAQILHGETSVHPADICPAYAKSGYFIRTEHGYVKRKGKPAEGPPVLKVVIWVTPKGQKWLLQNIADGILPVTLPIHNTPSILVLRGMSLRRLQTILNWIECVEYLKAGKLDKCPRPQLGNGQLEAKRALLYSSKQG